MMEKKIYSKPMMLTEEFVPQSFIAACWVAKTNCVGGGEQYYVFTLPDNNWYADLRGHAAHNLNLYVEVEGDTRPTDAQLEAALLANNYIKAAVVNDSETKGAYGNSNFQIKDPSVATQGYTWTTSDGQAHFATSPLAWVESNHS